ncbi:hypothetical protein TNCV_2115051 [Trichonephila clavipes]|nr:hypothetical protein TNCV_2115051 [Trichonephila clavipes]
MTLADCRRPLFTCRMVYRSSPAVVVLGRPPPTFLTAVPVVWNAFQARETFVDSELCSYTGDDVSRVLWNTEVLALFVVVNSWKNVVCEVVKEDSHDQLRRELITCCCNTTRYKVCFAISEIFCSLDQDVAINGIKVTSIYDVNRNVFSSGDFIASTLTSSRSYSMKPNGPVLYSSTSTDSFKFCPSKTVLIWTLMRLSQQILFSP